MSDPTVTETPAETIARVEGVIVKSPKGRSIIAVAGSLVGLGLSGTTLAYASLISQHVVSGFPVWLNVANSVAVFLGIPAYGVWKANIK